MTRKKWYVGLTPDKREIFASATTPTVESHGNQYGGVIGPFATKRGAAFMASPAARGNPHCQTAGDADRIARTIQR